MTSSSAAERSPSSRHPAPPRSRARNRSRGRGCCWCRRSSTRTFIYAPRGARTRRTSRRALAPPRPAATAGSSRWPTRPRPSTPPRQIEALRDRASAQASIPCGFLATVTRGMKGEELTDMVEIGAAGALGFSDDGLPIRSSRVMRRALQYQAIAARQIALHEEDPDLSGAGVMHEGEVSAALGLAGVPSISESTMIARDAALAAYEDARIHVQHLSARQSVEAVEAAKAAGVTITCEATPHHLTLTHEELHSLDSRFKMNPPLRFRRRPPGDCRRTALRGHRLHRDRPRTALRRREGGADRGGRHGSDRA